MDQQNGDGLQHPDTARQLSESTMDIDLHEEENDFNNNSQRKQSTQIADDGENIYSINPSSRRRSKGKNMNSKSNSGVKLTIFLILFNVLLLLLAGFLFFLTKNNLLALGRENITLLFNGLDVGEEQAINSFGSFFKFNTYPIAEIIVSIPQNFTQQWAFQTISQQTLIKFVSPIKTITQLDQIIKSISNIYYFYLTAEWEITDGFFIQQSLQYLMKTKTITQVVVSGSNSEQVIRKQYEAYGTDLGDMNIFKDIKPKAFSFQPSLHKNIGTNPVKNIIASKLRCTYYIGEQFEQQLSKYYLSKGLYSVYLKKKCARPAKQQYLQINRAPSTKDPKSNETNNI